jgi:hypothetical protein
MSQHVLRDPSDPHAEWRKPGTGGTGEFLIAASGAFPRVPVLVPFSAPQSVLEFAEDGTASGLVSDPTVIPPAVAAWAKGELAHLPGRKKVPWPGPHSGLCCKTWAADYGLEWMCSLPKGHAADVRCEALGESGATLASPTAALVTEALKPARRKPTPRPRVQKVVTS